jgi:RNA polymerase sigma-70 factor, ECF subfamily
LAQDGGLVRRKWNASEVRQLYQQHGAALVAYACSFLPNVAAAEDAVHSVFLRLLRTELASPDSAIGYLYRAVKNAALNQRRDFTRNEELRSDETWLVHQRRDSAEVLALQQALADLPEEQREVVVMRIWSGMTLEEIGAATGVTLNTAASRYRYALEKLRERLAPTISKKDRTSP